MDTTCLACGQTDQHPKHSTAINPQHDWVEVHYDCHAAMTPRCELCADRVAGANGATGDAFRAYLVGLPFAITETAA